MKKNKKAAPRKKMSKTKKIIVSVVSAVLVVAIGCSLWYYYGHKNTDPVFVYDFMNIGMTEYWGDNQESYGPVTTDNMQAIYLTSTQDVTEVFVNEGDTVKKGDPLLAYDTTLSDLALEKKRLDVEKQKLQLEAAQEELKRINSLVPMAINPTPAPNPTPENPDQGTPLSAASKIISGKASDGSSKEKALVCWIRNDTAIDDNLLETLRLKAQEFQSAGQTPAAQASAAPVAHTEIDLTETDPTGTDPTQTDPTGTDPTQTDPEETSPTETTPEETNPIPPAELDHYFVVFKITDGDMSKAENTTWQGMRVNVNEQTGFTLQLFDASEVADPAEKTTPVIPDDDPAIDYNSGDTPSEIAQMRSEQEKTIKDLTFAIKMAEADYKIMQTEISDGKIYAELDGTVSSILAPEEALQNQQPIMKVSGGGGYYVEGSVNELDRDKLQIGQQVTINDWNTGMTYTGTVERIGDYPATGDNYSGSGNPNASYYPFTVFVDESADLQEGYYVSVQYSAGTSENGIYLENPFIRTENGKSYVYVQGEDGLLEKRYVTTGKALWGSYTEILSGLSETDLIAFPYGKNVEDGAQTVQGDMSDLYNY